LWTDLWNRTDDLSKARERSQKFTEVQEIAECFEWVRVFIQHRLRFSMKAGTMLSEEAVTIAVAISDEQILATREVMLQLRPSLALENYLPTLRRMMQTEGYRLVALSENGAARAVAGYRIMEMLYCGKIWKGITGLAQDGSQSERLCAATSGFGSSAREYAPLLLSGGLDH
jgi:hypothetical protein